MTQSPRRQAIYNPGLLRREELIDSFVARTAILDYLLEDLRHGGGQHHVIIGQRGAGKTTLLLRLACAIEDDTQLSSQALALRFPEEQYNVARVSDLWLNCLDALVDALERREEKDAAVQLERKIAAIEPLPEDERQRASLDALLTFAERADRLLVLLIDNVDLVLGRLSQHHWGLRETLSRARRLVLIGASSAFLEESSDYQAAFYEFFNLHELHGLEEDEAKKLLLRLAQQRGTPQVLETIEGSPERIKALLALSGGTPRTLVLLYDILAEGSTANAEDDLEALLDQLTPYYKARFDDLAPQSQQVVDAVAMHWYPLTAVECEEKVRLGQNATSSLLNRLAKQGVISRASGADSPKLTFQISERFFNIWYLMRASRRLRRRLLWLVGFLQSFYGAAELERRASALLEASGEAANDPARLLAFASAVSDEKLRQHLELRAVQRMVEGPKPFEHWRELLDLDGEDRHLGKMIERSLSASSETAQADDLFGSEAGRLLARNPYLAEIVKQQIRDSGIDEELTHALLMSSETWKLLYGERVLAAIEAGELPSFADVANEDELWRLVALAETDAHFAAILYSVLLMVKWQLSDEAALKLTETPLTTMLLVLVIPTKYREHWTEGEALIRRLLEHCVHEPSSPMLFPSVWIDFVMEGRAEQAAQALFDTGKHELALPLYEALRAIGRGAPSSLLHLPAELRSSTAQVVSELLNVQEDAATARIEMKRLFNPKKKQTKQRSRGSVAKKPRRPAP